MQAVFWVCKSPANEADGGFIFTLHSFENDSYFVRVRWVCDFLQILQQILNGHRLIVSLKVELVQDLGTLIIVDLSPFSAIFSDSEDSAVHILKIPNNTDTHLGGSFLQLMLWIWDEMGYWLQSWSWMKQGHWETILSGRLLALQNWFRNGE